jgi:hypothetical protein
MPTAVALAVRHIASIQSIYEEHGHLNRDLVAEKLNIPVIEAAKMVRAYISHHAHNVVWDRVRKTYIFRPDGEQTEGKISLSTLHRLY